MNSDRLQSERDFHDIAFGQGTRSSAREIYRVARQSYGYHRRAILDNCCGKRVLDYGCGQGSLSLKIAAQGGIVTGIDVSAVAISQAQEAARARGLSAEFRVMDAENLDFPDGAFDMVCGTSILHHLDLKRALTQIARVMADDGVAIFLEPLGHNPVINWHRNRTPDARTPDEHPLLRADLELTKSCFNSVRWRSFHLTAMAAHLIKAPGLFAPCLRGLEMLDGVLLGAVPPLRYWAWIAVLELGCPIRG